MVTCGIPSSMVSRHPMGGFSWGRSVHRFMVSRRSRVSPVRGAVAHLRTWPRHGTRSGDALEERPAIRRGSIKSTPHPAGFETRSNFFIVGSCSMRFECSCGLSNSRVSARPMDGRRDADGRSPSETHTNEASDSDRLEEKVRSSSSRTAASAHTSRRLASTLATASGERSRSRRSRRSAS